MIVALTLEHIGAYGAHTRWPTSSSGWEAQMLGTPSGAVFQFSSLINAGIIDTNSYFTTSCLLSDKGTSGGTAGHISR